MRIRKVKITKYRQVLITYEDGPSNGDEYSLTCREQARPEFYTALKELAQDVIECVSCRMFTWIESQFTVLVIPTVEKQR